MVSIATPLVFICKRSEGAVRDSGTAASPRAVHGPLPALARPELAARQPAGWACSFCRENWVSLGKALHILALESPTLEMISHLIT